VGAVWLDGRNLEGVKDEDEHTALAASMTLRYAAIDADGKLSDEAQLDERVCECCQTSATLQANDQSQSTATGHKRKCATSIQ